MKDYAGIATKYARDVTEGRILACRWVQLACQRHLDNLQQDAAGWRYTWNPELETTEGKKYRPADRACHFIELLPHIKGDWAANAERILLGAWQVFIVCSIFGWVDRDTLKRRFRFADIFVPRKNGKSTLMAAIGLYLGFVDGEYGAEVYSGATSEKQAGEVFKPAKLMASQSPDFLRRFGVSVQASNISALATNSKFETMIGKPGDGASPSAAIIDEYHEHATPDQYDTMRTGMGARKQPLLIAITTAGDDISSPCYAHQTELQMILEGLIENETRFGIIYTIDVDAEGKLEDWTSEAALLKANPNFGVSIDAEGRLSELRDAIRDPRKQAVYQTKYLNLWVASAHPWLPMHAWKQAADPALLLKDFAGEDCWEGIDLANVTDIASRCKTFKRMVDGEEHYYVFWRHYLPEAVIATPENHHYQAWEKLGLLTKTSGAMIDQRLIETDLIAEASIYRACELAFDPWGAPGIMGNLENEGFTVCTIPLKSQHLSAPMKFIDGLLKSGRLHHNGDLVAAWGVNNVECKPDHNDNWFPRKQNRYKKTDPGVALILSVARAMAGASEASLDEFLADPIIV